MVATFTSQKPFVLQIPPDADVHMLSNSMVWFDKDGILYSRPTETVRDLNNEELIAEMAMFRQAISPHKKVCMLAEAHPSGSNKAPAKDQRDLIASEVASVTEAMAVIVTSAISRVIINLFFAFKPPPYPVKMFKTEPEAREWLKKYLK